MTYLIGTRPVTAERHVIVVGGELDLNATPELKAAMHEAIDQGATTLVIDLGGVTFIDSTAIGALLAALNRLRRSGGALEIVCEDERVLRILEIVGIGDLAGAR
jgi:anti-sigma B factor antagonist